MSELLFDSSNELEVVRTKTSFRVSRVISGQNPDIRAARKQVIKMLLMIIIVFFFCWGPKLIVNIIKRFELSLLHSETAFFVKLTTDLLPYVQSCANPVIYSFMSN